MKLLLFLTLFISLVAALEFSELRDRQHRGHKHKKTSRPKRHSGAAPSTFRTPKRPSGAPAAYRMGLDKPSRRRTKSTLKKLPSDLIDPDSTTRRSLDSMRVVQRLKRQSTADDFYECTDANPAPADADCDVIIDQVAASNDDLSVAANSCLVFTYQTCEGFFCSLCDTLDTTTDFVANQLGSADDLCVANGQDGTVVGEDPPQWDAGFVAAGDSLPTYDVC